MNRILNLFRISPYKIPPVVSSLLCQLSETMRQIGYNEVIITKLHKRVDELSRRKVAGVEPFLRKLLERVSDRQQYRDILMEGRFAIILAGNGFSQIEMEFSDQGPDIKANHKGNTVYFEVTRKRPNEQDEDWEQSEAAFVESATIGNVILKIHSKMSQLRSDDINIVVIWSDAIGFGKHEVYEAFEVIKKKVDNNPDRYKDLSGVLLTEGGGFDVATMKQFYLFRNDSAQKQIPSKLTITLEKLSERDKRDLRREIADLEKAIKRLRE